MARGSIGRQVARAARTGGSRNRRGPRQTPLGFYTTLAVVVLLGMASVAFSRYQVLHPSTKPAATAPAIGDHWLTAIAFDICGKLQPNPPKNPTKAALGIYTTGNGLIQVAPRTKADAGHNATLGRFVAGYPGMVLTATSVGYPGHKVLDNGALCGSKPGRVQVKVFSSLADTTGSIVSGNPDGVLLENGQLITVAFVAAGTSIPRPPSATTLALAAAAAATTTTTVPHTTRATTATKSRTATKSSTSTTVARTTIATGRGTATASTAAPGASTAARP